MRIYTVLLLCGVLYALHEPITDRLAKQTIELYSCTLHQSDEGILIIAIIIIELLVMLRKNTVFCKACSVNK